MAFVDDVNRLLRDFSGYSGDGQGNVGALPVGDSSTSRNKINLRDLRELLVQLAQTMGDPSALQEILDQLVLKADKDNDVRGYVSRAEAVAAGQDNLPGSYGMVITREGGEIVFRGPLSNTDDPLFATSPYWGVFARLEVGSWSEADASILQELAAVDTDIREDFAAADAANLKRLETAKWGFAGHYDGSNIRAVHNGSTISVGWSNMSVRRPNGQLWSIQNRAFAELPLNGILYVDAVDTSVSPLPVLSTTASPEFAARVQSGEVVVLLHAGVERTAGLMASMIELVIAASANKQQLDASRWEFAGHFDGSNITAAHSGSTIFVGWSGQSVRRPTGQPWPITDRPASALPLNGVLYLEVASPATPWVVLEGVADAAFAARVAAGEVVVLLQAGLGRTGGLMADIVESIMMMPVSASMGMSGTAAAIAQTSANDYSWDTGATVVTVNTPGWYAYQSPVSDRVINFTNAAGTVDLEHLPLGKKVLVSAPNGCDVFMGPSGSSDNFMTFSAGSVFRATRIGQSNVLVEAIEGSVTASSIAARPAMDRTIVMAGQSQNSIGSKRGSLGGFADQMLGLIDGLDPVTDSFRFIDVAISGSSATKTATANYWWDDQTIEPGPLLEAAVTKIQAEIAAGQPAPEWINWRQGEGDARAIHLGNLTGTAYREALRSIWSHFRSLWPDVKILASPVGWTSQPISPRGVGSIRLAYYELTQELPWAHYGSEMYDLPINYSQVHLTDDGYYCLGIRDALAIRKIDGVNPTLNLGPEVLSATIMPNGTVEVEVGNASSAGMFYLPARDLGPFPYGMSIILGHPAGADPLPVSFGTARRTGAGEVVKYFITLYPQVDVTGAALHTVATDVDGVWKRSYPMNPYQHSKSPALPMRYQRVALA